MADTTAQKNRGMTKYLKLDLEAIAMLREFLPPNKQGPYISELVRRDYYERQERQRLAAAQCRVCGEVGK